MINQFKAFFDGELDPDQTLKFFGSVALALGIAAVGLSVPGWFIYRTVNYQLKRDACLSIVATEDIRPGEARKRLGIGSWNVIEYCEFFK